MSDIDTDESDYIFAGGVVNAGLVRRIGSKVYRPAGPHTPAIHALLRYIRSRGFNCAPQPFGLVGDRECLSYIEGNAAPFPYPEWFLSDEALCQVARTMRRYHDAAAGFSIPAGAAFNHSLADPQGGPIVCHNDISLENTVFKDGEVAGFIDFDFAAPGRPLWDVSRAVILWVPIDNPELAHSYGFGGRDVFARLRLFCDNYRMEKSDRLQLLGLIDQVTIQSEAYVRGEVDAGNPAFVELWTKHNLAGIYARRREWLRANGEALTKFIST